MVYIRFLKEFRRFVIKGNAADMGVGIVLGAAFSGLIDSLVKDILLPPVGLILAKVNLSELYISLSGRHYTSLAEAQEAGAATVNYGVFITNFIRFIFVLFAVFIVIRQLNRWKKPNQDPAVSMTKKECPFCCTSIPSQAVKCPNCSSELDQRTIDYKRSPKLKIK
ncbi:large conductance mechanosensitive channel protein MscL [Aquibacillus sp. 3ASR75-11]|uniref:Large-conductance mechanosensitive channel n=1 Tax=Terrihalobacillus insolitus TaxID=2950438 RepID=A0A9X3WV59_9BACI|nr:large conductance mechanosensitive channel protein MscL [Terrihalobacillus insolitus]MDC3413276.1 large conductance mechanosensitive channel protein MscL [Terrihalobacillus insolitus]MDC3426260.1 large conductance mechanosensitive channel protein MscL [Terrihalobacillus insolitus]